MKFLLLSLLLLAGLASAAETPMEYAQGWRIETPGQQALYQLDLPYEVLAASRHDLSDIVLFDAAGQPLTWWREPVDTPLAREEQRVALAVYPDGRITTDQTTGEILIISKPDRTEIRITPQSGAPSSEQRPPADAYIVLVPDGAPPLAELELHWHGASGSRVEEVRIKAGETLSDWRAAGGGAIARLQGDDEAFLQRRVPLHVHKARFYRIEWDSMPVDWQLEAVYGIGVPETRMPTMEWRSFTPLRDGQTLTITSEALLRPEQIKLTLAGDNEVLAAIVKTRNTAASSWHRVYQGVFYRLHGSGGVLRNPPRPLTGEAMRELRLEVTTGQASSVQTVELGWIPPRVIFVAGGSKPYVLAAGAAEPGTAAVMPAPGFAKETLTPGLARLAAPLALGGKAALMKPRLEINWKTVLLWSLLLTGTVMVLFMVWRLAHSTNKS